MDMVASPNLLIASNLGWQDVKQAYRRSVIGPFWLTIGVVVQVITIALVFGVIFKVKLFDYLPFLACSLVTWGMISTTINEAGSAYTASEAIIKQIKIPHWVFVFRVMWRNLIVLAHNIVIIPLAFILVQRPISISVLEFAAGLVILTGGLASVVVILATVSARFRDIPAIVASLLTVVFYVTPVMWTPENFDNEFAHYVLGLNPFYHWLQVVRLPLLGENPTIENWIGSLLCSIVLFFVSKWIYKKSYNRIAYWL